MNHYGRLLADHVRRYRPREWAAITQPEFHFNRLGDQMAHQISTLRDRLYGAQPPSPDLDEVGRRSRRVTARAEEMVLAQWLSAPEPASPWDPERQIEPGANPTAELLFGWARQDQASREAALASGRDEVSETDPPTRPDR